MKKYKLIKTYPGGPKLGLVVEKAGSCYTGGGNCYASSVVENHPEYWQEVADKVYRITAFHDGYNEYYRKSDGKFTINLQYDYEEETLLHMVSQNRSKIIRIKRLSDGESIAVGDVFYNKWVKFLGTFTLQGIELHENFDRPAFIHDHPTFGKWLDPEALVKVAQEPLFVSEDGVKIFEKDEVYVVRDWKLVSNFPASIYNHKSVAYDAGCLWFSTEEAAENYIHRHSPCLSVDEVLDFFEGYKEGPELAPNRPTKKLLDGLCSLVKNKIEKQQ